MEELQRLLALREVYDTAIEELYVLGDRGLVDLILRLERRWRTVEARIAELGGTSPITEVDRAPSLQPAA